MRSKGKARKLAKTDEVQADMEDEVYDRAVSPLQMANNDEEMMEKSQPPVYIPEDVVLPEKFELRESRIAGAGLGVFTKVRLDVGEKFGPFAGLQRVSVKDTQYAWEIVDEFGKVKCWIDASEPGTGNWMKYVRSAPVLEEQNMIAVQINEQVHYKVLKSIEPGEELMVIKDAAFPDQEGLPLHMIEERRFKCGECDEVFRSKVALRRHQKYVCKNDQAIFSTINEDFKQAREDEVAYYAENTESTDGESLSSEREYKCDSCPKSFNWKSNLIRHQVTHDTEKRFNCENCDKIFTDPSNLQRHIRTQHVGARCHACPECGKTFATSSGLKQHTHIHSSVKPFTCEVCYKSYTQFSNLCRHKRMHADCRTQIKCSGCNQVFSTVTSLNKHRRFCTGHQFLSSPLGVAIPLQPHIRGNRMVSGMDNGGVSSPVSPLASTLRGSQAHLALMRMMPPHQQALLQSQLLASHAKMQFPVSPGNCDDDSSLNSYDSDCKDSIGAYTADDSWIKHYTASTVQGTNTPHTASNVSSLKEEKGKDENQKEEEKKIKTEIRDEVKNGNVSDDSEGTDVSNVSTPTGSDLESTSGSDCDSESERENGEKQQKQPKPSPMPEERASKTPEKVEKKDEKTKENSSLTSPKEGHNSIQAMASIAEKYFGTPPSTTALMAAEMHSFHSYPPPPFPIKVEQPFSIPEFHRKNHGTEPECAPFDLSRKSIQHSPVSNSSQETDQPLDLSVPNKKKEPVIQDEKSSSKKTHIYGDLPKMSQMAAAHEHFMRFAFPRPTPFPMDPIYRVEKRKYSHDFPIPSKYIRMDYPYLPPPQFAPMRKFDPYGPRGLIEMPPGLNKMAGSPPSHNMKTMMFEHTIDRSKGKDRYTCKFCGKIFPRSANLTRHLRTHTGEQPYSCKYCDRSFSISSNLQRHVRNIHNKEKPFKCPMCDRCFGQQTNLDRHLKKHENEKQELMAAHELNSKDESYFEQIHNFIGEVNTDPKIKESQAPGNFDANFSIMDQISKSQKRDKDDESNEKPIKKEVCDKEHTEQKADKDSDDKFPEKNHKINGHAESESESEDIDIEDDIPSPSNYKLTNGKKETDSIGSDADSDQHSNPDLLRPQNGMEDVDLHPRDYYSSSMEYSDAENMKRAILQRRNKITPYSLMMLPDEQEITKRLNNKRH